MYLTPLIFLFCLIPCDFTKGLTCRIHVSKWAGIGKGGLKTSSPAPLFLLTANKRLPSFTETAHCERKEAMASQDPPSKNAAPLKACSSPHRWHVRFPAWPISCRIFTTEAQYWETSEPRRSVLVWMKWLQDNYYCYVLLFDQMLLFFMPDILSICVKTCKSLLLHITHEI